MMSLASTSAVKMPLRYEILSLMVWYQEVRNCGGDCQPIVMRVQTGPQVHRRMILRMLGADLAFDLDN
jgi:hypothetical protein